MKSEAINKLNDYYKKIDEQRRNENNPECKMYLAGVNMGVLEAIAIIERMKEVGQYVK